MLSNSLWISKPFVVFSFTFVIGWVGFWFNCDRVKLQGASWRYCNQCKWTDRDSLKIRGAANCCRIVCSKLGQIIWLKKLFKKNLTFVLVFVTQIGSNQVRVFLLHAKQMPFLKLNNVEQCQIMGNLRHFWSFLSHFYMFFALLDINKKTNNYSFWFDFSNLKPNNLLILIHQYSTLFNFSG